MLKRRNEQKNSFNVWKKSNPVNQNINNKIMKAENLDGETDH